MSGKGCGEPMRLAPKEGARGGTMGSPAHETGGSPCSPEEGGSRGNHGFPHERSPKASVAHEGSSVNTTGYSAELLPVFVSPGTGCTSTWTVVSSPNGKSGKSPNVTVFVSPGSITSIVPVFVIGFVCPGIVSFTLTPTSWFSPEFVTPTSNERSVEIVIFVSCDVESCTPAGLTFV